MGQWQRAVVVGLALVACTVQTPEGNSFGGPAPSGPGSTAGSTGGSAGTAATDAAGGSTAGTMGGTAVADSTGSGDGPGQTTSSCEGAPGSTALGGLCSEGCDCASGECFAIALGAACSECISDVQCMAGGGPGTCSVDPATDPTYATCTQGELGVMCQPGSGGCQAGLLCAQLIDTNGLIPDYFCSACATSADCPAGQICSPVLELSGGLSGGYLQCVAPGSLANGDLCPLLPDGTGDGSVCSSMRCAVTDVGGLNIADIGVCSPCATNVDCGPGQSCLPAVLDSDGAVPAMCG
ncbi:MAG: hypothetical protein K0V04_27960 [Deltaproteobacteria bacterium]|nr:hypothetical protein [Deltaproteobacteria bacterium]